MMAKILSRQQLKPEIENLKKQGKKIIATSGAFDILHAAHVRFLKKAKSLGDTLIILLNSDSSIQRYKGENRPIIPEKERAELLASLAAVDYVCIFDDDAPLQLLKEIKPDFFVKGGSFIPERIAEEKKLLESWGGQHKTFPLEEGLSTTKKIEEILKKHQNETLR